MYRTTLYRTAGCPPSCRQHQPPIVMLHQAGCGACLRFGGTKPTARPASRLSLSTAEPGGRSRPTAGFGGTKPTAGARASRPPFPTAERAGRPRSDGVASWRNKANGGIFGVTHWKQRIFVAWCLCSAARPSAPAGRTKPHFFASEFMGLLRGLNPLIRRAVPHGIRGRRRDAR
jgi:hypothetical protein